MRLTHRSPKVLCTSSTTALSRGRPSRGSVSGFGAAPRLPETSPNPLLTHSSSSSSSSLDTAVRGVSAPAPSPALSYKNHTVSGLMPVKPKEDGMVTSHILPIPPGSTPCLQTRSSSSSRSVANSRVLGLARYGPRLTVSSARAGCASYLSTPRSSACVSSASRSSPR